MDATDVDHPNGMHPDQHRLVTNPRNPGQFFEASDGGIIRYDRPVRRTRSSDCDSRGLDEPYLSRCHELLSAIPTRLESMNRGLGHAPVPEPLGEPVRQRRAAGRHAGQRNVGELRKHPDVAPDVLGRRRPVGLRRDRPALPLPHVLRRVAGRELLRRRDRRTGTGSPTRSTGPATSSTSRSSATRSSLGRCTQGPGPRRPAATPSSGRRRTAWAR